MIRGVGFLWNGFVNGRIKCRNHMNILSLSGLGI